VAKAQRCAPVFAFSAYTFLSSEPTNTVEPSGLTTGDYRTQFPVEKTQLCVPFVVFSVYTFLSSELTNTVDPSG
jgi:hypothetical protein